MPECADGTPLYAEDVAHALKLALLGQSIESYHFAFENAIVASAANFLSFVRASATGQAPAECSFSAIDRSAAARAAPHAERCISECGADPAMAGESAVRAAVKRTIEWYSAARRPLPSSVAALLLPGLSTSVEVDRALAAYGGVSGVFGGWFKDEQRIAELRAQFGKAKPFPFVELPDFFSDSFATGLVQRFPPANNRDFWMVYDNPIERKLACSDIQLLPDYVRHLFDALCSPQMVSVMEKVTGIQGLLPDPYLHGGGMHMHPPGGKLDMHLDYSIHPRSAMERRLNLIVYLNQDWQPEYGGALELWEAHENGDIKECVQKVHASYNKGALFRTSDYSYHGLPDEISCPSGMARRSIAVYYVSASHTSTDVRYKARFVGRPSDPTDEALEELRRIRSDRRVDEADMERYYAAGGARLPPITDAI